MFNIRNLYVGENFEAGFIVVCDVRKEPKDLIDQLTDVQVEDILKALQTAGYDMSIAGASAACKWG